MRHRKSEQYSIYLMVIVSMILIGMPIFSITQYLGSVFGGTHITSLAKEGYLDITSYDYHGNKPLSLNGEWKVYRELYLDDDYVEISEGLESNLESFPVLNLKNAVNAQTYQLFLKMDAIEDLVLSIPLESPQVRAYLNGHPLEHRTISMKWITISSEYMLHELIPYYDDSKEYQELIISVPSEIKMTNLFNRNITISIEDNYIVQERVLHNIQFFLIGAMIMVIVVGFSYMVLVPSYSTLTIMNLFDSALMFHILFNMSTIPQLLVTLLGIDTYGGIIFRRLDIFFLLLACLIGTYLAKSIFDPENKVNKWCDKPIVYMLAIVIVCFFIWPELVNTYASMLLIALLVYGMICFMLRFRVTVQDGNANFYKKFHLAKTIYIGAVVFLDMASLAASWRNNTMLFFLYALFFIVHIVVKAYEYRLLFVSIENMNKELEVTVEERTKELMIANEELKEISCKDALTKSYNRLYFEEQFDKYLTLYREGMVRSIYLCMFDLDKFKSINDVFGHAVGDEQLIEAADVAKKYTSDTIQFARIGGEEFTVLFINMEDEEVLRITESLRLDLEELSRAKEGRTTGSFGIFKPDITCENQLVFTSADQCLYYSKEHGRNQITYNFQGEMVTFLK
ncbi:MAG: diguanylate cyclase [Eubacteriales bacterium]